MKEKKNYYLNVEGETEKWYFLWLQNMINNSSESRFNVRFNIGVKKDPVKHVKNITIIKDLQIICIFDRESQSKEDTNLFRAALDKMKEAENLGKTVKCKLGYSNLSFELWMILHKTDSFAPQNSCDNYLRLINGAYDRAFESLKIYKQERNFNYLLQSLNINDVIEAVERGRIIMENCAKNSAIKEYKGYKFYDENPSLSIHEIVARILKECGLMN